MGVGVARRRHRLSLQYSTAIAATIQFILQKAIANNKISMRLHNKIAIA
jgi:hypothetical protein